MRFIVVSSVAVLLPVAVHAHHGFGSFDRNSEVSVTGAITGVDFVNPHAYVYFEVRGEDGTATPWRCELPFGHDAAPFRLVGRDVRAWRADRDHGRARSLRSGVLLRQRRGLRRRPRPPTATRS